MSLTSLSKKNPHNSQFIRDQIKLVLSDSESPDEFRENVSMMFQHYLSQDVDHHSTRMMARTYLKIQSLIDYNCQLIESD